TDATFIFVAAGGALLEVGRADRRGGLRRRGVHRAEGGAAVPLGGRPDGGARHAARERRAGSVAGGLAPEGPAVLGRAAVRRDPAVPPVPRAAAPASAG